MYIYIYKCVKLTYGTPQIYTMSYIIYFNTIAFLEMQKKIKCFSKCHHTY